MTPAQKNAEASLKRIQDYDTSQLARERELGSELNFAKAIEPAERLISLFRQVPLHTLGEFSESYSNRIKEQADAVFNLLEQMRTFSVAKQSDPANARNDLINSLSGQYDGVFDRLLHVISYAASRLRDFASLEREGRAAIQGAVDRADEISSSLAARDEEANRILEEVRRVAAEQGVAQQAHYFKVEADAHETDARRWRWYTVATAVGLGVFSFASLYTSHLPGIAHETPYASIQIGISKFLIFAVITFMLVLCARNFIAHRHNLIVNRHRQNALLTFAALVDAAKGEDKRDIVLTYAAACIFAPQDTGFARSGGSGTEMPTNLIQAIAKPAAQTTSGAS